MSIMADMTNKLQPDNPSSNSKNSQKDIIQDLKNLGLDKNEALVYIDLCQTDETSILDLSKSTNIPRTTVYRIAETLVEKRFAEWVVKHKAKYLKATPPDSLIFLVKKKKSELETVKDSVKNLQELLNINFTQVPKTQIRYFQGREGIKQQIWNTLNAKDEILGYSEFGRRDITGAKFHEQYVAEFKKRRLSDRVITNEKSFDYIREHVIKDTKLHLVSYDIRVLSQDEMYISGDTCIYNNVYSVGYWGKGEIVGVEIENTEFVKLHRSIFKQMWEIAKPLEKVLE